MTEGKIKVGILLVSNNEEDSEKIKTHLDKNMRVPWNMMHCINVKEATLRINKADVIILDLSLKGLATPKEIFEDVEHIAHETPIIVLTGEDEYNLATYVMEQGAADKIVRGKFGRLVDAIEFALIRQKITKDTKTEADKKLTDSRKQGASDEEKQRQILRMLGGGYATDQQDKTTKQN